EKRELAAEERGLVPRGAEQARIAEPHPEPRCNAPELEQLLVDHPAGPLTDEQEPRARRPPARRHRGDGAKDPPKPHACPRTRRDRAPRGSRRRPRRATAAR